jgi:DNA ligase-associated metallophosphoesterase
MQIEIAGEEMLLDRDRAMFWPRRRTLIVADVHLGKGSAFRRAGVAVPSGSTRDDLARLSALITRYQAEQLLVLGDLFHAPLLHDEAWFDDVDRFLEQHRALDFRVIRGNHDRIGSVPLRWDIQWHEARHREPPFLFMHDAREVDDTYAIGGHVHPVITLRGARDKLRVPVLWLRERYAVLPSFGAFTGGFEIATQQGDRVIGVCSDGMIDMTSAVATVNRR